MRIQLEMLRGEVSKCEILRREGIHWATLRKFGEYPERLDIGSVNPRTRPNVGPYLQQIAQIIESTKSCLKMQRHTTVHISPRIKDVGYHGNYTQVKNENPKEIA